MNFIAFLVLHVGVELCLARYDLYTNATETEKLLGFKADFYFVKEGKIKTNAVSYPVNVPTDVNCLAFTWHAVNLENAIFFSFHVTSNVTNIVEMQYKPHGKIPSHKQDLKAIMKNVREGLTSEETKVFYIAVGVACAVIFIMAMSVGILHVNSIPKPDKESEREPLRRPVAPPPPRPVAHLVPNNQSVNLTVPVLRHTYLPPERLAPVGCASTVIANKEAFPVNPPETSTIGNQIPQDPLHPEDTVPLREKRNKEIRQKLQDIVLDRSRVSLGDVIQEGTFGKIYEGVVTGPEDGEIQNVFVKTVSGKASDEQASLLLAEGSMLKGLNHQNICSIAYVCLSEDDADRPFVLTPSMSQGNLKNFLKKSRTPEGTGLEKSVTTRDLIDMALQIADGMLYLEMRNIVHKDLATRNCLIDDEFHVKISDCALSRDLFPMDYNCLGDNENKPVKWMSVESLEQHRFTTASDVWSFGVTLWELITLGQQPYGSIDAFEMVLYLKNGHRLGQPTGCPDDLFTIMGYCWALSEEERPDFGHLMILLTKFFNALIQFI